MGTRPIDRGGHTYLCEMCCPEASERVPKPLEGFKIFFFVGDRNKSPLERLRGHSLATQLTFNKMAKTPAVGKKAAKTPKKAGKSTKRTKRVESYR